MCYTAPIGTSLCYTAPIGNEGSFILRGDVGAGDTDLTWNALAGFGYQLGQSGKYQLGIVYRHMEIELEDAGRRDRAHPVRTAPRLADQLLRSASRNDIQR